jgi:Glutamine amidotransferase domain/Asparagine synthase
MSTLAGLCYWDGRPVSDAELAHLATHSQPGGPARGGTQRPYPWLALQAFVIDFDRLSAIERQPYPFGEGSVLTWDGRLDNREDLLLDLHRYLAADITDAAIVAAVYQRWGSVGFRRLLGDWALALWDAASQRIVLARDYFGTRPLYYRLMPNGIAWATAIEALAACFNLYEQPSENYILAKLSGRVPPGLSPFTSVSLLRAGHFLMAPRAGEVDVRRYWTYAPAKIRYCDPRAYTDHLRILLEEAVRVRLRARGTVWSHLSGGWDSSSVVCLASRLVPHAQPEARRVQPLSLVYTGDWADRNDDIHIEAVEAWCGVKTLRVDYPGLPPIKYLLQSRLPLNLRDYTFGILEQHVREAGDHVVLTGSAGDLVMLDGGSARVALTEPLDDWQVGRFLRLCVIRARHMRQPVANVLMGLVREYSRAVLFRRLLTLWRRDEPRPRGRGLTDAAQSRLRALNPKTSHDLTGFSPAKRAFVAALYSFGDVEPMASVDLYRTDPYTHRPLVEFMLGTPGLVFWEPGGPKRAGMARALADILPPKLLGRQTKMYDQSSATRARRDQFDELYQLGAPSTWQLVTRGYLDHNALAETSALYGIEGGMHTQFPLSWIKVEAWLQALNRAKREQRNAPSRLIAMAGPERTGV